MKKVVFFLFLFITINVMGQDGSFYVAAKNGLSMREEPDASSKLITKIPYGEKVVVKYITEGSHEYIGEGLVGMWVSVAFNGKKGYIVDNYLLPTPPPKPGVNDLKQYLEQLSPVAGSPIEIKNSMSEFEGEYSSVKKQLFKNGGEYHLYSGFDEHSYTFFLPNYNLQQAFVLLRFLSEYKTAFSLTDAFPTDSKTFMRGDNEITVKVEKVNYSDEVEKVVRIKLSYEEGALYDIELFELDNQVVMYISSAV